MISISIFGNRKRPLPGSPPHGIWCKLPGPSKGAPLMNSDFKELFTILNDCQVDYLVVGGYAYIHYAEPRYTKDIDLWIRPTMENALRLREALVRFGGWVEGMTLEHFTTERTMFQIGLPPCRVDFLTSIPGLEFASAFATRKVIEIGSLSMSLVSLADLITARRTSGREQDLRDVVGLERVAREEP